LFDTKDYPDLLIGLHGADDAAVWRLDSERAIVVTTDFFTPVVDDPYDYGRIAAANSLSDIYAMGGIPFLALNVAAFPPDLPAEFLSEILRGGAEKTREAGAVVAGGHTVQDKEPKFGLVALGFVHPEKMLTKGGLRVGDALVITKPLGFGVTTTALKQEKASDADVKEVVDWMSRLNKTAGSLALEFDLHAGTDVTGFSLLGHGSEMSSASGVGLNLSFGSIPFTNSARKYAQMGTFPGGAFDNKSYFGGGVTFDAALDEVSQMLMFDPQTSGGLLLGVPQSKLDFFLARAQELDQPAWVIGEAISGKGISVAR
jgi:selenide,water dikinase